MTRRRSTHRTLTGTRIYIRDGQYKYLSPEPMLNPKNGKMVTLHPLCQVSDGELKAREALNILTGLVKPAEGGGDICAWIDKWRTNLLKQRNKKAPKDPARLPTFVKGTKNIESALRVIEKGLADFDISEIRAYDIAQFLDQWEGQRAAQVYKSYLVKFFAWCISRHGLIDVNPATQIEIEPPEKRLVYMTHKQFHAIRDALLIGADNKPTRTGEMIQCYMDLLYLLFQRGTDIRLMRWNDITPKGIEVNPTKTEKSSGKNVMLPITPDLKMVIDKIKAISKSRSTFIISTEHGQPYTASGVRSAFNRAAERAGVEGVTLKDIRSKATTDAKNAGYTVEELQVALAHSDKATTQGYIRHETAPVSAVAISLPEWEN
jgi:integrase